LIKTNAFKIKQNLKNGKTVQFRKSEGTSTTTMTQSFIVEDDMIIRLEQLYLKYKKEMGLKDSKDLLNIIIKLKDYK
jgi:hypothetical protein